MVDGVAITNVADEEDPPQDLSDDALNAAENILVTKLDNFAQQTDATKAANILQQLTRN